MIRSSRSRLAAMLAASALLVAACGGDDETTSTTAATGETEAPEATDAPGATDAPAGTDAPDATEAPGTTAAEGGEAWTVNVDDCADPDAATAAIEGTIKIGSVMPLTGGPAAAFAPVAEGLQLYVDYANAQGLVPDYTLELTIEDDQYNKDLTPGATEKLLQDDEVNLFAGMIGSPNIAAVRDLLNEECVPQLASNTGSPLWGDVENYPWTTGQLVPYTAEARIYAAQMKELYPDGATVAMFYVNNEFGKVYYDAFTAIAPDYGLEIVEEQTIEATDGNPPTAQLTSIANAAPDVIMAIPLGAGCPTFLKELANVKAQNAGWEPQVFQTNTCAARLFLQALAGDAGIGTITSSNGKDIGDPANAEDPGVKAFLEAFAAAGLASDLTTTAAGWAVGEATVNIINAAIESGTLSRQSIIEAARNLEYTPSLGRDGVVYKMNGVDDAYAFESLQVLQWNGTTFDELGDVITEFEGTTTFE
jgi:branched-chain amino acid transport system substrate-binding protein